MDVSENSGYPLIIHTFNRLFPLFSPSILGCFPYFWKHPDGFRISFPPLKARKLILDEFGRELDEEGQVVPMKPQVRVSKRFGKVSMNCLDFPPESLAKKI